MPAQLAHPLQRTSCSRQCAHSQLQHRTSAYPCHPALPPCPNRWRAGASSTPTSSTPRTTASRAAPHAPITSGTGSCGAAAWRGASACMARCSCALRSSRWPPSCPPTFACRWRCACRWVCVCGVWACTHGWPLGAVCSKLAWVQPAWARVVVPAQGGGAQHNVEQPFSLACLPCRLSYHTHKQGHLLPPPVQPICLTRVPLLPQPLHSGGQGCFPPVVWGAVSVRQGAQTPQHSAYSVRAVGGGGGGAAALALPTTPAAAGGHSIGPHETHSLPVHARTSPSSHTPPAPLDFLVPQVPRDALLQGLHIMDGTRSAHHAPAARIKVHKHRLHAKAA